MNRRRHNLPGSSLRIQPHARQEKILDERTAWFYKAVTLSADMTTRTPGQGQVYLGVQNADGSVDLYFGPEPPKGHEKNWIETIPGRGWFAYFRFYAPTEAYFDRRWALPDIERAK